MAINQNGKFKFPKAKKHQTWRYFDSLPKEVKDLIRNAPYKIQITRIKRRIKQLGLAEFVRQTQNNIDELAKKSCAETYGKDHPQAK